jgi:hypothetical protein
MRPDLPYEQRPENHGSSRRKHRPISLSFALDDRCLHHQRGSGVWLTPTYETRPQVVFEPSHPVNPISTKMIRNNMPNPSASHLAMRRVSGRGLMVLLLSRVIAYRADFRMV